MKPFDAHGCTDCDTPHVDNCPNCFGYGLYKGKDVPIRAGVVQEILEKYEPCESKRFDICPICGGSPHNLDIFTLWGEPTEQKPIGFIQV